MKTKILALLGQARLYAALGQPLVAEMCLQRVEELLPLVLDAQDFLNLYLAFKRVELYLLPTLKGDNQWPVAA